MMPMMPIAIALSKQEDSKYRVTIDQVKNAYIVDVQLILNEQPPMSEAEAQRRIGEFIRKTQHASQGTGDPALDKALGQAQDEESEAERDILGRRAFYTLKELIAFLTFVFPEDHINSPGTNTDRPQPDGKGSNGKGDGKGSGKDGKGKKK